MKKVISTFLFFCAVCVSVSAQEVNENSQNSCPDDKHPHLIDLGLPSGTKWACCNVGADTPEDFGEYYSWGETEEKSTYSPVSYKYCTGVDTDGDGWYDENEQYIEVEQDFGDIITGTHDVALVKWGESWQIPTLQQFRELLDNCSSEWTSVNDVEGRRFTGPNGTSIFLPAAGNRNGGSRILAGSSGNYWSSNWGTSDASRASELIFDSGYTNTHTTYRYNGRSVRPVSVQK
jgi:uncharacterized protein (TIGR02145 family)